MNKSKQDLALEVAAKCHRVQLRKKTSLPYIVHPVSVMLIASKVTDDEDTLCACLLHDVLEDGDPRTYDEQDMTRDFGPNVTAIVRIVSKDPAIKDWRRRNEAYIKQVADSHNHAALIVCAADKVHNLGSMLADHEDIGDELWARFNAGKDQQKWWYREVLHMLRSELPDNALVNQLASLVVTFEKLD
jgi:(p)ppGpp synthase/HD superfamily hydrolase